MVGAGGHQARQGQRSGSVAPGLERPAIGPPLEGPDAAGVALNPVQHRQGEVQAPKEQGIDQGEMGQPMEQRQGPLLPGGRKARVGKHRTGHPLGMPGGHQAEDGAAPVLPHDDHVPEVEGLHQTAQVQGMEAQGMQPDLAGLVAQAQPHHVRGDHTNLLVRQSPEDLTPQEGPGGIAVLQEHHRSLALVHEVHAPAPPAKYASTERKLLFQPVGQRGRCIKNGGGMHGSAPGDGK